MPRLERIFFERGHFCEAIRRGGWPEFRKRLPKCDSVRPADLLFGPNGTSDPDRPIEKASARIPSRAADGPCFRLPFRRRRPSDFLLRSGRCLHLRYRKSCGRPVRWRLAVGTCALRSLPHMRTCRDAGARDGSCSVRSSCFDDHLGGFVLRGRPRMARLAPTKIPDLNVIAGRIAP